MAVFLIPGHHTLHPKKCAAIDQSSKGGRHVELIEDPIQLLSGLAAKDFFSGPIRRCRPPIFQVSLGLDFIACDNERIIGVPR